MKEIGFTHRKKAANSRERGGTLNLLIKLEVRGQKALISRSIIRYFIDASAELFRVSESDPRSAPAENV
ncbi:hypothetical protein AHAS_Ahas01G0017900 [Arachis hypogaea]